jgi:sarcosine oxidase
LLTDDALADFGDVKIARRTVVLAEVLESEVRGALATMPTMKYEVPRAVLDAARVRAASGGGSDHSANEAKSVYVLPPIYYPGPDPAPGWYVKIGGGPLDYFDKSDPSWVRTERELAAWMSSDGDDVVADQLVEILLHMFPSTNFQSFASKACAYSTSDDGSLKIQTLGRGENVIAVGACQGKGAGPSDAIGADVAARALLALDARARDLN